MADIAVAWSPATQTGDWTLLNGDIATGPDLLSAVAVSLFTDRVAQPDYVPVDGDRRGWWADTYEPLPIGSRLWQLDRAKKIGNQQLLTQATDICREALQWLVTDGGAARVDVQVSWLTPQALAIHVTIIEPSRSSSTFRFSWAWDALSASQTSPPTPLLADPGGTTLLVDQTGQPLLLD